MNIEELDMNKSKKSSNKVIIPEWAKKADLGDMELLDIDKDDNLKVISLDDSVVEKEISDVTKHIDNISNKNIDFNNISIEDFSFDDSKLDEILSNSDDMFKNIATFETETNRAMDILEKIKKGRKTQSEELVTLEDSNKEDIVQENEQNIFDLLVIMTKFDNGVYYDEEAARRAEEEAERRRFEAERLRREQEEANRRAWEDEQRRLAEEARRKAWEDEQRRLAEQEASRKAAEEAARKAAEEEAARRAAEEAARRAAEEAARMAVEELEEEPEDLNITQLEPGADLTVVQVEDKVEKKPDMHEEDLEEDVLEDDEFDDEESETYSLKELVKEIKIPDNTIIGGGM